ncbi:HAD family hydrolase [Tundrisphaera sp. TA3]|uniref:HAD family hydrolase n=1 Tax=Tundrisphaera sp. TA3 TaxID=3435775 RepID=UPI003EBEBB0C
MTIRAVIFDFNGVLLDDESVHCDLFREILAEEGVPFDMKAYHEDYLGFDDRGCFEAALTDAGQEAGRARVDDMIARKAKRYLEVAEGGLPYFPGAGEVVTAMADRWPIAINSGALRPEIELALKRLKVRDRVGPIVSAEDTSRGKPDPEGYRLAYEALRALPGLGDLQPGECLVIEDSLQGVASAKGAGMLAVGVAQTYSQPELAGSGADATLATTAEFTPDWVDRTFSAPGTNGH